MGEPTANLGVCFFADRLFYVINDPDSPKKVQYIGSFDFNFNVLDAVTRQHPEHLPHLKQVFAQIQYDFQIKSVRALTHPSHECWTVFPKVVYDNPDEREDHLSILMKGVVDEEHLESTWHALSKDEYKFLCIRRNTLMEGFRQLTQQVATTEFTSDFEMAHRWSSLAKPGGSYLMLGCHENTLSISSMLLGKFRAATYLTFDHPEDMPYHWLQYAQHNAWLKGIHESIYLFGHKTHEISDALRGFWDESSEIIHLNSLDDIGIDAEEKTYGFDLSAAFPAILLSLNL